MLIPFRTEPDQLTSFPNLKISRISAVYFLMTTNVTVFGWQLFSQHFYGVDLIKMYTIVPFDFLSSFSSIKDHAPRLLYGLFFHDIRLDSGFLHLIGNMLYLSAFGPDLENRIGCWMFLAFYLLSGILSTMVHIGFHPGSTAYLIGASGAIAGIMGGHLAVCRGKKIRAFLLVTVVPVSTTLVLLAWIALQIVNAYLAPPQVPVAWGTHIAGFIVGLLMMRISQTTAKTKVATTGEYHRIARSNQKSSYVPFLSSLLAKQHLQTCKSTFDRVSSSRISDTATSSKEAAALFEQTSSIFPPFPMAHPLRTASKTRQRKSDRSKKC
ncbi:hypothetical protein CMK14_15300 [Candidatus Poribacteria bacterium]|nr:hypothetical protein [Candidatus Poribacteria bacterium]